MIPLDLDRLLDDCPYLFHMAERGAWSGIQEHGLLSTSSLLDLYGIDGDERRAIESKRRDETTEIEASGLNRAKVRVQLALSDKRLQVLLPPEISPRQWYEFLNGKVFFWLTKKRLDKFSNAKAYRNTEHEVLMLNSRKFVEVYRDRIWLSPINSGCTFPSRAERDYSTFSGINDYPYLYWRHEKKRYRDAVVELCVDDRISNIVDFVERVYVVCGTTELYDLT